MKKLLVLIGAFLLVSCSSADPIQEYIKEGIVIETNSKVKVEDVIKIDEVKDEKMKEQLAGATVEIDFKNNETIDKKDVKEDKIFANNKVKIKYKDGNEEKEKEIDVKVKDTKTPEVTLVNDYYFTAVGNTISKDDLLSGLGLKVKDNGVITTEVVGLDKIDFNKVKENEVKIIVSDEANNIVENKVIVFVGKSSKEVVFNISKTDKQHFPTEANKVKINIPSAITSSYEVKHSKDGAGNKMIRFIGNDQYITLTFYYPFLIDYPGYDRTSEYNLNNFNVVLAKPNKLHNKNNKIKNNTLAVVHSKKYGLGYIINIEQGANKANLKWITDNIVNNTTIE